MPSPKTRNSGKMTEAAYFGWIRSQLRRTSMKWGPIAEAKRRARRPYTGPNKRQKWEYQCAICKKWFKGTEIHVDHIIPCGTLTKYEDLPRFVERMLCEVDGLQVLCKPDNLSKKDVDRAKGHY